MIYDPFGIDLTAAPPSRDGCCLSITRTIRGQDTAFDGDIYIAEDGSHWRRLNGTMMDSTAPATRRYLRDGKLCIR